jgi:hypothetical protein
MMWPFRKPKAKPEPEPEPEPKPENPPTSKPTEPAPPKHPKPKIILLDVTDAASNALLGKGFNVTTGTLGKPYQVQASSSMQRLTGLGKAPNHTEQEVIIVDYAFGKPEPESHEGKHRADGEDDLWGKCSRGFLDPRVRTAVVLRKSFDRALQNGGLLLAFADAKTAVEYRWGRPGRYGDFYGEDFDEDEWSLVSPLKVLGVSNDHGEEMRATDDKTALGRLVAEFLPGSQFTCTLNTRPWHQNQATLAVNKYGAIVAASNCRGKEGTVIVLPQIADKVGFLTKFFLEVLPELVPALCPYIEKGRWLHLPEYELPEVIRLKTKQAQIAEQAKKEIAHIESQIAQERAQDGWMQNLLTGTDSELVDAVKKGLAIFGFNKVVDIDAERDAEGKGRREDLQIQDESPLVVVDVKGISGCPQDADALQAAKHAFMRVKDLNRADIKGLTICNHQRHVPPNDRDPNPFRQDLINAAEEQNLGLVSAWDFYRLLKNFKKFGWQPQYVKPLFYQKGRIHPIPTHYSYCGTIAKAWTDKFGIITEQEIRVGDKVAVEFEIEFEEAPVDSIQVVDRKVDVAKPGDKTGILWPSGLPKLREGQRVFRIRPSAPGTKP